MGGFEEQERRRLADRDRDHTRCRLDRGDHRARPGHQAVLGRIDRVAVGDHEQGAGPGRVGSDGQSLIGDVGIEPDDDRVRPPGRLEPVEPLGQGAGRCIRRRDHLEPEVLQLAAQTRPAERQDTARSGRLLGQPQGRCPGRADHSFGADRSTHRGQPRDVVGPVVHRVVGHVDDVVAEGCPRRQHSRDPGYRRAAAIDDAVEVDQEEHRHSVSGPRSDVGRWPGASPERAPTPETCQTTAGAIRATPGSPTGARPSTRSRRPAGRHRTPADRRLQPAPRPGTGQGRAGPGRRPWSAGCGRSSRPRSGSSSSSTGRPTPACAGRASPPV